LSEKKDFIKITDIEHAKTINKPWGYERWIADGAPDFKYALKEIMIRKSFQSSIQFHEFKHETTYVQSGNGYLHYNDNPIDIKKFNDQGYSNIEIQDFIQKMKKIEINSGKIYHIKPGIIHRVEAITDLAFIESSTIELDDVIRINDEWGRNAGKVESEHLSLKKFGDFYKEQKYRLNFVKEFSRGKVLHNDHLINTGFSVAKELLNNNCSEVWHENTINQDRSNYRYLDENDILKFKSFNNKKFTDSFFDTIITFETIQYEKDPLRKISTYYELLKDDGILIISTANKNKSILNSSDTANEFTKDEFVKLLSKKFSIIDLFSQRNISDADFNRESKAENNTIPKFNKHLRNLFRKLDPDSNFYKLHLQKTILNIREKNEKQNREKYNPTYIPIPYENHHTPLIFIAICKKNNL
jgi:mannose-6-phosphate isomerase